MTPKDVETAHANETPLVWDLGDGDPWLVMVTAPSNGWPVVIPEYGSGGAVVVSPMDARGFSDMRRARVEQLRLATADELLTGIVSPRTRKEQSCR